MKSGIFKFTLAQQELVRLVQPFAATLQKGDTLALWGNLGAGKTTFARMLIQTLAEKKVDVPSPTFTLIQTYDCPQGELWHCDLYRLEYPEEVLELGLEDAFHQAICLIEWPERLGAFLPQRRIDVTFTIRDETTRDICVQLVGSHGHLQNALQSIRS